VLAEWGRREWVEAGGPGSASRFCELTWGHAKFPPSGRIPRLPKPGKHGAPQIETECSFSELQLPPNVAAARLLEIQAHGELPSAVSGLAQPRRNNSIGDAPPLSRPVLERQGGSQDFSNSSQAWDLSCPTYPQRTRIRVGQPHRKFQLAPKNPTALRVARSGFHQVLVAMWRPIRQRCLRC